MEAREEQARLDGEQAKVEAIETNMKKVPFVVTGLLLPELCYYYHNTEQLVHMSMCLYSSSMR